MRGHIKKRSKDSWTIIVELGRDPITGKRKRHWQSLKGSKKDAERELSKILTELDTGVYLKPAKITVGEFLEKWLEDYASTNVRPKTAQGYTNKIRCHLIPGLGKIPLTNLKPGHLQSFYRELMESGRVNGNGGLEASTVRHIHRLLKKSLNDAVKWGLLGRNVCEVVDPPRASRKETKSLDVEDVHSLFDASEKKEYYPVFYMAIYTGLRRSELLGLRWRDIDMDMATLSVVQVRMQLPGGRTFFQEPKTAKGKRQVALSPATVLVLRQYREQQQVQSMLAGWQVTADSPVFCYADGSPILPDGVTHAFKKTIRSIGFEDIRFHDLRHTHASLMLKQGIHPKVVSERMGHSTVSMTLDTYSHVTSGIQEAAALSFDECLSRTKSTVEKR